MMPADDVELLFLGCEHAACLHRNGILTSVVLLLRAAAVGTTVRGKPVEMYMYLRGLWPMPPPGDFSKFLKNMIF